MSPRTFLSLLSLILAVHVVPSDGTKDDKSATNAKPHRWFVSFEESGFSDNAGLAVYNLPDGTDSYRNKFSIWSPRFALGYRVVPKKWSCEFQLQMGPRESFEAFKGSKLLAPAAKVQSRFLTTSLNRTYSLRQDYEIEAKIGVVNASFDSQVQLEDSVKDLKLSETSPMLAIGLRKRIQPRLSAGIDFTKYYLSKTGTITTGSIGLRYEF